MRYPLRRPDMRRNSGYSSTKRCISWQVSPGLIMALAPPSISHHHSPLLTRCAPCFWFPSGTSRPTAGHKNNYSCFAKRLNEKSQERQSTYSGSDTGMASRSKCIAGGPTRLRVFCPKSPKLEYKFVKKNSSWSFARGKTKTSCNYRS